MPDIDFSKNQSIIDQIAPEIVPSDPQNLKRCVACGKTFQNQYSVKTHYQNVHLKVLHPCPVEGCKAMLPSKRSRDRHAKNKNLHRKLTTNEQMELKYEKSETEQVFF